MVILKIKTLKKNLNLTIKKCNDKISLIEKQYDECEKALRKKIEDFEKIKSELNDLKAMRNLEKELKETQNEELSLNKGIGNEIRSTNNRSTVQSQELVKKLLSWTKN